MRRALLDTSFVIALARGEAMALDERERGEAARPLPLGGDQHPVMQAA